jgi:putative sensor protein
MSATPRGRAGTSGGSGASGGMRLRLGRDPVRLVFSGSPWRAAWFLACYVFAVGWVLFAAALTVTVTAACLLVTLAGFPLLVAAAAVLRGCAGAERFRLRGVLKEPVRGRYRSPARPGLRAEVATRWKDGATWRDVAYLIGLWPPLFILDTTVLAIWITFLAGVALPAWYWAVPGGSVNFVYSGSSSHPAAAPHGVAIGYFPHGPFGHGGVGVFIDTLPRALLAAAGFLILFLLFNYVVVLAAKAHARVARSVLSAPADPLAEAKEVLARPGPLGSLTQKTQTRTTPGTTAHNGGRAASNPA